MDETKASLAANQHTEVHPGSYHVCCNYQLGGIEAVDSELNQLNPDNSGCGYSCVYPQLCWPRSRYWKLSCNSTFESIELLKILSVMRLAIRVQIQSS